MSLSDGGLVPESGDRVMEWIIAVLLGSVSAAVALYGAFLTGQTHAPPSVCTRQHRDEL